MMRRVIISVIHNMVARRQEGSQESVSRGCRIEVVELRERLKPHRVFLDGEVS
jgi:hypothetical protein